MRARSISLGVAIAASVCLAVAGQPRSEESAESSLLSVALPRPAQPGEAVWLKVLSGTLPLGADLVIRTRGGELLGTVSPVGNVQSGRSISSLIPLPQGAFVDGKLVLKLEVVTAGAPPRAPRPGEVESIEPIYVPVGD